MFDHNRRHGRVGERSEKLSARAVEPGADFCYDAIDRMTV